MIERLEIDSTIFLVGMMGTGKSTVGRILASVSGLEFIDSDSWIEARTKKTVAEIFESQGEDFFRSAERRFIEEELPLQPLPAVVSCGGGLCIPDGMMDRLKAMGIVVCLWADPEQLLRRISTSSQERPLLQAKDPLQEIQKILNSRKEVYRAADLIIETSGKSPEVVSDEILARLKRR